MVGREVGSSDQIWESCFYDTNSEKKRNRMQLDNPDAYVRVGVEMNGHGCSLVLALLERVGGTYHK